MNKLSTSVVHDDLREHGEPSILVSEILGTLMLSESALEYVYDARERLLGPEPVIIPASGCQYVTMIECSHLNDITSVEQGWDGFDLSGMNALKDTANLCFTKQFGFRLSSLEYTEISIKIPVIQVDFYTDAPGDVPPDKRIRFNAIRSGTITAALASWEVYGDKEKTIKMSTHPDETKENFAR